VEPAPPFRFPVLASAAPLAVAAVLWLLTSSPYSLLFALLGPVTAVASFADSRFGGRRARRRERTRYEDEVRAAREAVESAHDEERAVLAERTPGATELLSRTGADPARWRYAGGPVSIALGTGRVQSEVVVPGADDELGSRAAALADAPVAVDAALGIGVCGPPVLAAAVARALVVELGWTLSPASYWCAPGEPWAAALPHALQRRLRAGIVAEFGERGQDAPLAIVAIAADEASLPPECRVVLALTPEGASVVRHPDRERRRPLRAAAVSAEAAGAWARAAASDAEREGVSAPLAAIPASVHLASLPRKSLPGVSLPGVTGARGLACAVGMDAAGPVVVDLVSQGPHAVIGGTTGSGKSELLVSWVIAMAEAAPPEAFTVLLVDFKGGSAFAPLERLPHTVGIVTDLDGAGAARALASLRAELRHRERVLAAAGARSIDDTGGLPRLVIVVDEFAAMLADHPDLHTLFVDLAARGRSLGVHLILCTQRPAGVVRDAVLANADLRISLRVNNRADSTAVVGTDAAADVSAAERGRGVLAPPDSPPRVVQFAIASASDVERAASRWPGSPPPRRPWCEPLPPVVDPAGAPGGFGLLDLPEEQRRDVAAWSPRDDGHVLVLGSARSGTSTALAALQSAVPPLSVRWVPGSVPAAWDALEDAVAVRDTVLVIDDADSLLARFPADYRPVVTERLAGILRDGPARGVHVVMAAKRVTADLQPLAPLMPSRLLLRHASKQDWVIAGGDGADFAASLPPGGGLWHGHRVQVVAARLPAPTQAPARMGAVDPDRPLAVVTTRPAPVLRGLPAAVPLAEADLAALPPVTVGDVEEWQSRWGALAAVRRVADVVLDGCSAADIRALTRSRELPPPLTGLAGAAWRLEADGTVSRVAWEPVVSEPGARVRA
jgi:S-DNA-T family DNA segregation ATPase FtsK/SpoIIIE